MLHPGAFSIAPKRARYSPQPSDSGLATKNGVSELSEGRRALCFLAYGNGIGGNF